MKVLTTQYFGLLKFYFSTGLFAQCFSNLFEAIPKVSFQKAVEIEIRFGDPFFLLRHFFKLVNQIEQISGKS